MTAFSQKKWAVASVWGAVCIVWISAWLLFLFASGRLRSEAAILLLVCGVVIAMLSWRKRRDSRDKEE